MTVFVFDVETSGKPDFKMPADHPDQPYICEIAALLMDGPGSVIGELDTLIKPDRWLIDPETEGIHGISAEMCEANGRPIGEVLVELTRLLDQADVVAGYSVDFDLKMFRGACRRLGMDDRYAAVKDKRFDVMRAVKPLCKIPPTHRMQKRHLRGFKLPKLQEAVEVLLKRSHDGAHRAAADCRATAELYWYVQALDGGDVVTEPAPMKHKLRCQWPMTLNLSSSPGKNGFPKRNCSSASRRSQPTTTWTSSNGQGAFCGGLWRVRS